MVKTNSALSLCFIGLCTFLLTSCATAADDSSQENGARIIAIGDLHGDYDSYRALMRDAGLMDKRGRWSGGDTIFVQTGDVPDRGPSSLEIIESLRDLQKQAARKGGQVIALVGNHEAMNINGDLRYVHPGEYEAFTNRNSEDLRERVYEANRDRIEAAYLEQDATLSSEAIKDRWMAQTPLGMIEHQQAWRPDGEVGEWIVDNPAVAIVDRSLFVHGGISEKYASVTVEEINAQAREALVARSIDSESIINDPMGPLWYRGLVQRPAPEPDAEEGTESDGEGDTAPASARLSIEDEVALVLDAYNIDRIIVGHTPSLTGITASQDGRVIQIDTGIADYYGGVSSYLRIEDGIVYAHDNGAVTIINGAE